MLVFLAVLAIVLALCMGSLITLSAALADNPHNPADLTPCIWPLLFACICFILHATGWTVSL